MNFRFYNYSIIFILLFSKAIILILLIKKLIIRLLKLIFIIKIL